MLIDGGIPLFPMETPYTTLAYVWHIIWSADRTNILLCVGIGIGYKSIVKLKFCTQPMHQIYDIKYCIYLKTSLSK